MNKLRYHKLILLLLITAVIILLLIGASVKPGIAKSVLLYLVIAMGVGAIIEGMIFAMKPGWFREKSRNPDEDR